MTDTSRQRQKSERQDRLAEALRANLKRRKAQQKEWRSQDTRPPADATAGEKLRPGEAANNDASTQEPC